MNKFSKKDQGFTMIELVMVIVVLAVLASFALPKFVDLAADAGIQGNAYKAQAANHKADVKTVCNTYGLTCNDT
ncbi:hypothetical protein CCP3SC15_110005 [Gammaproteobacteria bacterium]